jgi:hypothetical protein
VVDKGSTMTQKSVHALGHRKSVQWRRSQMTKEILCLSLILFAARPIEGIIEHIQQVSEKYNYFAINAQDECSYFWIFLKKFPCSISVVGTAFAVLHFRYS